MQTGMRLILVRVGSTSVVETYYVLDVLAHQRTDIDSRSLDTGDGGATYVNTAAEGLSGSSIDIGASSNISAVRGCEGASGGVGVCLEFDLVIPDCSPGHGWFVLGYETRNRQEFLDALIERARSLSPSDITKAMQKVCV